MPDGKQPYAIARADGAPLAFAGLWEIWSDPAGGLLRTFAIITTTASADVAPLHDRLLVILERSTKPFWLRERVGHHVALLKPAAVGTVRL
jgi:putative SOS response-associated peptidase YedK